MDSLLKSSTFENIYVNKIKEAFDKIDSIEKSRVPLKISKESNGLEDSNKRKFCSDSPDKNKGKKNTKAIVSIVDLVENVDNKIEESVCDTSIETISFPDSIIGLADIENDLLRPASTNSVILLDDSQIPQPIACSDSPDIIQISEVIGEQSVRSYSPEVTVTEVVQAPTLRRSNRLHSKTTHNQTTNDHSLSTTGRRKRNQRKTNNKNIEVVTFDEEYPIPVCNYVPEKKKCVKEIDEAEKPENDIEDSFTVFVKWNMENCVKFELSRYQLLKTIFEHFAQLESIPITSVLLSTNEFQILTPKDTPDSAKFSRFEYLKAYKTNIEQEFKQFPTKPTELDKDSIELKVLLQNQRPLTLSMKKNQSMKVIIAKCAGQLECSENDVVLYFDGEKINPDDKPDDLDLEGGECLDAHVKK